MADHLLIMETQVLDPLDGPQWEEQISAHPDANFFHGSAWARVLSKTYGHRPLYLRGSRNNKTAFLLPMMEVNSALTGRRGVCLPFTDLCGPLVFDVAVLPTLVDKLREFACERRWQHFELRGCGGVPTDATAAVAFYGHTLGLHRSAETISAGFASAIRRAIRKAERSELRMQVAHTRESVCEFYRLHVRTRRRHGVPPQPISFFLRIWEEVILPGLGFVSLAWRRAKPIAAAMFFCRAGRAVYKFGASDETFQALRPNNLVMWEAIRFLLRQGARSLHFGRTSLHHEGLRRFKLAWGTTEETIRYFRFDLRRGAWAVSRDKTAGFHNVVFGHLPLALNRLAGTVIYPHLD